jgi:hypothetical protein
MMRSRFLMLLVFTAALALGVGTVAGSAARVGLVVQGSSALLFFCGGDTSYETLTHWMHGSMTPNQSFSLSDMTASATGTFTGNSASGTLTPSANATPLTWTANAARPGTLEGLYTADVPMHGSAGVIIAQASTTAQPIVQGAFHSTLINAVLQVTPLTPIQPSDKGLAMQVMVNSSLLQFFVTLAGP